MNKIIKNVISYLLLIISIFSIFSIVKAEETPQVISTNEQEVNVYMFRGDGCGYCAKALTWFEEIEQTEGNYFNLIIYEVWNDESNKNLMDRVAKYLNKDVAGVPFIIIGEKSFTGFDDSYKDQFLEIIHEEYLKNVDDRFDVMKDINGNKDLEKVDFSLFIVGIIAIGFVALVFVARNSSSDKEELSYEDIIIEEEKEKHIKEKKKVVKEPNKEKTTKEAKETKKATTTKKTTKKTTSSTKKKTTTKKTK